MLAQAMIQSEGEELAMIMVQGIDPRDLQDVKDIMEANKMAKMEYVLIPHWLWADFKKEAADRGIEFSFTEDDEWIYVISDLEEAESIQQKIEVDLVA